MNRIINILLTGLEWVIPLLGITRLTKKRIVSVIFATTAHLVPLFGCVFAEWDPVAIMLVYWVELAFVILIMFVMLIIILVIRVAELKKLAGKGLDAWYFNPSTIFLVFFFWLMFFPGQMAVIFHLIGGIAKSHYELESLSAVFDRLMREFFPSGGITVFLQSESASLALMLLSSTVILYFQFSRKTGEELLDKVAYVFAVKPLARLIAMYPVFGLATVFSAERLPAVVTVAVLAFAMALIDQRIELIDHDFGHGGKGDPGFKTPHGALLNFAFQIMLIIISTSFLVQSAAAHKHFERILKNPVKVNGMIVRTHLPDEERYSIVAQKYWWFIDVEYRAVNDPSKPYMIREVKTLFDSESDPKGKSIRVLYESGNPRNAFIDVYEDRQKPGLMFRQGLILFVFGLAAWWAIDRFLRG